MPLARALSRSVDASAGMSASPRPGRFGRRAPAARPMDRIPASTGPRAARLLASDTRAWARSRPGSLATTARAPPGPDRDVRRRGRSAVSISRSTSARRAGRRTATIAPEAVPRTASVLRNRRGRPRPAGASDHYACRALGVHREQTTFQPWGRHSVQDAGRRGARPKVSHPTEEWRGPGFTSKLVGDLQPHFNGRITAHDTPSSRSLPARLRGRRGLLECAGPPVGFEGRRGHRDRYHRGHRFHQPPDHAQGQRRHQRHHLRRPRGEALRRVEGRRRGDVHGTTSRSSTRFKSPARRRPSGRRLAWFPAPARGPAARCPPS